MPFRRSQRVDQDWSRIVGECDWTKQRRRDNQINQPLNIIPEQRTLTTCCGTWAVGRIQGTGHGTCSGSSSWLVSCPLQDKSWLKNDNKEYVSKDIGDYNTRQRAEAPRVAIDGFCSLIQRQSVAWYCWLLIGEWNRGEWVIMSWYQLWWIYYYERPRKQFQVDSIGFAKGNKIKVESFRSF